MKRKEGINAFCFVGGILKQPANPTSWSPTAVHMPRPLVSGLCSLVPVLWSLVVNAKSATKAHTVYSKECHHEKHDLMRERGNLRLRPVQVAGCSTNIDSIDDGARLLNEPCLSCDEKRKSSWQPCWKLAMRKLKRYDARARLRGLPNMKSNWRIKIVYTIVLADII